MHRLSALAACVVFGVALTLAACGGDGDDAGSSGDKATISQLPEEAANPRAEDFPSAAGKSLQQLTAGVRSGPQLVPATSRYVLGENRLAFGLLTDAPQFIYAPTAVYVARKPNLPARGPYLAPADSLLTEPSFRSKQAALEGDVIASIYGAEIPFERPGDYSILILSDTGETVFGATGELQVAPRDEIPAPGDPAPEIETETLDGSRANLDLLETRDPPDQMHEKDFADVVGERPVALLFATPALCESRVCGPVTDIAAQLQQQYGDRVEFIHQEPYVGNDPSKGLRPPLEAFNLQTEPWLFTFDADGRIAARLEGSFGVNAFEGAVKAALGET